MKRLITLMLVTLAAGLTFIGTGTNEAESHFPGLRHGLSCESARDIANHPNADCYKTSANHAWLFFDHRICVEHVYWRHVDYGDHHLQDVEHCPGWHD